MLGLPIVPSIGNLDFWLRLCNVRGLPESQALLAGFPQSEGRDKEGHAAAVREWNADLIRRVSKGPVLACAGVLRNWRQPPCTVQYCSTVWCALPSVSALPVLAPRCAQFLSLPGVAGLHVMPLTKAARQMTLDFLADGTLPSANTSAPASDSGSASSSASSQPAS